jgi:carboxypeptidase C (cathepsin A)
LAIQRLGAKRRSGDRPINDLATPSSLQQKAAHPRKPPRTFVLRLLLAALLFAATPALAAETAPRGEAAKADAKPPEAGVAPLPAERSAMQSAIIAGKPWAYQVRVTAIPVVDDKGKTIGQVMVTAYTVANHGPPRPVTFAFNGGPGAASAFLNFGAIGPKHVQFGAQGDAPSDRPIPTDNANSWLDFTDLVFIDPIGTGFSRSFVDAEATKKAFYAADPDIAYLSRVIFDWLVANKRMTSRKYLIGESYGGYRVPRVAFHLTTRLGVGLAGIVMVSPALSPPVLLGDEDQLSPLGYVTTLPSMHAAWLERQGKLASPADLAAVEAYARGEFATDLLKGRADPAAIQRLSRNVAALTGLDPALVQRLDGRVGVGTFLRETHRETQKLGSIYDSNVTIDDPFPASPDSRVNDPILDTSLAPVTGAAVDLITNQLGYQAPGAYALLNYAVNNQWDWDKGDGAAVELRKLIAIDPRLAVIVAHGMDDLACPYFVSRLVIDQMPRFGRPDRVQLALFAGGHMFYNRPASAAAFHRTAMAIYP